MLRELIIKMLMDSHQAALDAGRHKADVWIVKEKKQ